MERWWVWRQGLNLLSRQSPPQIVEAVMLLLAIGLCITWLGLHRWQFLVLSLSYSIGAIASILAREWISPSPHTRWIRFVALASLGVLGLVGWALSQTATFARILAAN